MGSLIFIAPGHFASFDRDASIERYRPKGGKAA